MIQHEPISDRASGNVSLDGASAGVAFEIPLDAHLHDVISELSGTSLEDSIGQTRESKHGQKEVPKPQDEKDLERMAV